MAPISEAERKVVPGGADARDEASAGMAPLFHSWIHQISAFEAVNSGSWNLPAANDLSAAFFPPSQSYAIEAP